MYDLTHIMTDLVMCVRLYITYSLMQLMDSGFKTGSAARFLGGQQTSPSCAMILTRGSCKKVSFPPKVVYIQNMYCSKCNCNDKQYGHPLHVHDPNKHSTLCKCEQLGTTPNTDLTFIVRPPPDRSINSTIAPWINCIMATFGRHFPVEAMPNHR